MQIKRVASATIILCAVMTIGCWNCSKTKEDEPPEPPQTLPVNVWVTSSDRVNLFYAKTQDFAAGKDERFPVIDIDPAQTFQTVEGFGYALTGGSAYLLRKMGATERTALLRELFSAGADDLGVSYLRVSMGASDLDVAVFSYNDLPAGQTDPTLQQFTLSRDTIDLIPVLKEILAIRPDIKIMASPWSAPTWMKTNGSSIGGNLRTEYYPVYAQYFVKYIQAMQGHGIPIDAVTVQNEPQHGGNNPSMVMSASQQSAFIKNHLGPAFQAANLSTKIVVWDHNCDNPAFPISILNDPGARQYVAGSAFHLYAGDISALSAVHDAHPDKHLYFTEQWTGANSDFGTDFRWHLKNVIIGSMRHHSRVALEWNLANDPNYQPHTPGGCNQCKGALTLSGSNVVRNVSYYIIGQISKFVSPGSVRIGSTQPTQLDNVAFRTPQGKTVLLVLNETSSPKSFNIHDGEKWIVTTLNPGTAGTFAW